MPLLPFRRWCAALACALTAAGAQAHGGLAMEQDMCKLTVGPFMMHFAGYQEDAQRSEFCEDIPHKGRTIVVLDFIDASLRDMPIEVRVVRKTDAAPEQSPVVMAVEPRLYPSGTLTFTHDFAEDGNYVGLVWAGEGRRYAAVFPFAVGADRLTPKLAAGAAVLLLLGVGGYALARRRLQRDVARARGAETA